jgi:predicted nucleotidyltransferase
VIAGRSLEIGHEIHEIAARHGARNIRVFGSVTRADATHSAIATLAVQESESVLLHR